MKSKPFYRPVGFALALIVGIVCIIAVGAVVTLSAFRLSSAEAALPYADPNRLKFVVASVDDSEKENRITLTYRGKTETFESGPFLEECTFFNSAALKERYADWCVGDQRELLLLIVEGQGFTKAQAVGTVCNALLYRIDNWLKDETDIAPTDARISFFPDAANKFQISREASGVTANRQKLYSELYDVLIGAKTESVEVTTLPVKPAVTAAMLRQETYLRSSFSTKVSDSSADRRHNVGLALSKFNGYILPPGQTLSFNTVVGPRTAEAGYREAKIILNGKYEPGIGGGVCQSSTTLYNAALLADLEIKKATRHSLMSNYIEPSFDAMVNSSWSDLVLSNPTARPVYIATRTDGSRARVEIYGQKPVYKIERKSVVEKRIAPPAEKLIVDVKGEYSEKVRYSDETAILTAAKEGLESKGFLEYYDAAGNLVKTKQIRTDKYASVQGVAVRGAAARPLPPPVPVQPPEPTAEPTALDDLWKILEKWLTA